MGCWHRRDCGRSGLQSARVTRAAACGVGAEEQWWGNVWTGEEVVAVVQVSGDSDLDGDGDGSNGKGDGVKRVGLRSEFSVCGFREQREPSTF